MKKSCEFKSQGIDCAAWYFEPEGEGPFPTIVMAHGLGAIKEMRLDAYAARFQAAGYACLVFDYRFFGESGGEPRQVLNIKEQHKDWIAAVQYASSLPNVDKNKIILWGSSLSGGHVLEVAAKIPSAVAAVVSQVPHLSAIASLGAGHFSTMFSLSFQGFYDKVRGWLGMSPHYVQAADEPGKVALMNVPGAKEGYLNIVPEGVDFDMRVAARFAIDIAFYSPVSKVSKLSMPIFMQVGLQDTTTPAWPIFKVAEKKSNLELQKLETGHFEPYLDPLFTSMVDNQIAFLKKTFG